MAKITLGEKLFQRTRDHKLNKIIKQMKQAADDGKSTIQVIPANVDPHTISDLKAEGIAVELKFVEGFSYKAYTLSW